MKDLRVAKTARGVAVRGVRELDPDKTFGCGQCFRWRRSPEGGWVGVAGGRVARVSVDRDGTLFLDNVDEEGFRTFWHDYLDLGTDYAAIRAELSAKDPAMRDAAAFCAGLRLLRQEPWETLASFILSSSNNIPRIRGCVEALAAGHGKPLRDPGLGPAPAGGWRSFPSASKLANLREEEIGVCRGGYRTAYLGDAARKVRSRAVRLDELPGLDADEARGELTRILGVGPKVADCALLFSGAHRDVFPVDVWVGRVMGSLYFGGRDAKPDAVRAFAEGYFGPSCGIAGEWLFHWARHRAEFGGKVRTNAG